MPGKVCENCGKSVEDYVKFCPDCGSAKFRQTNPVSQRPSSLPTKEMSRNSGLVHKLLYWDYDGNYILSKTKVISLLTLIAFLLMFFTGSPGVVILLGLIFAAFFYIIGFCFHKILGNGSPSDNVLKHNDYGLLQDLKHAFLCWQNKRTGEFVYSKTKIITLLIFIAFAVLSSSAPMASLFVCLAIGIIFAVPACLIGYVIHKLTNNDPAPTKKVASKPKPQAPPKKAEKKVEVKTVPKIVEKKSEFEKYQSQLNDLKGEYDVKEKRLRDLIAKRFEPPQMTYNRFITAVDNCTDVFNERADSIQSIIDLASEDSKRIDDEIKSRMETLKSLIDKIDDLTDELVLNMGKSDDVDVRDLLGDMENLIDSVKDYD